MLWECWKPSALGGACPRLSPVGGKAEQKRPGEVNIQTNPQTRDVLVVERERAHSSLGPRRPALPPGLELRAARTSVLGPGFPKATCDPWLQSPDTSQSQAG